MAIKNTLKTNDFIKSAYEKFLSLLTLISPTLNTKIYYFISTGKRIDLKNPKEFNEKILWLKLNSYTNNKTIKICADKYAMRSYIIDKGYENILNDIIAVYDSVEEIDWDNLPDKFAMKLNFGCGFNIICKNKKDLDIDQCKKRLNSWIKSKYYLPHSEMQYKNVPIKILVEKFIETSNGDIPEDYKFYCFNGDPKIVLVCNERDKKLKYSFYDMNWEYVHVRDGQIDGQFDRPTCLEEMVSICKDISREFPFVRIDFYVSNGKPVLGELTFTPAGGTGKYTEDAKKTMGEWIKI